MVQTAQRQSEPRAPGLVSKTWVQGAALVMVFGFLVMGILAYRTYTDSMPQPERVVTSSGQELFTSADITAGQQLFLRRGLQEYGSIVGHGGYLGPDWTADYLRRSATIVLSDLESSGVQDPQGALVEEFRTNRYDEESGTLEWTDAQAGAFEELEQHYADFFGDPRLGTDWCPMPLPTRRRSAS